MPKLNQILAVEKGQKAAALKTLTALHRKCEATNVKSFGGFAMDFKPVDEAGAQFPPESLIVQNRVSDLIEEAAAMSEYYDTVATKDVGNQTAIADVVVDGAVLLAAMPVPTLLFLEKQLTDLEKFVSELPVLSEDKVWELDASSGLYRSAVEITHRTQKVQKALVLHPPTTEHPAQTQLVSEDVIVGHWHKRMFSGCMDHRSRKGMLARVRKLKQAVQQARQEANTFEVKPVKIGDVVLNYVFG